MTHNLYVGDDGAIRNGHVENIFDDLYHGKPDDLTGSNLCSILHEMFPDCGEPPENIITNLESAIEYASRLGYVTYWRLTPDDYLADPELYKVSHTVCCKIGDLSHGQSVTAANLCNAVNLAIVQMVREISHSINNIPVLEGSKLH